MQSSLVVEVWDGDYSMINDVIDNFTIPLFVPLDKFNLSHSLTLQGKLGVGNLTLNYGNLTTDPMTCPAATQPTCSANELAPEGNSLSAKKYIHKLVIQAVL